MSKRTSTHHIEKMKPVSVPPDERGGLDAVLRLIEQANATPTASRDNCRLVAPGGESVALPATVSELIARLAELLARGEAVAIVPSARELTTQQAADLLNVSRQYLVRLVDTGVLPASRTGRHRRLRVVDVLAHKERRDRKRRAALDELTRLSEETGGYAELKEAKG